MSMYQTPTRRPNLSIYESPTKNGNSSIQVVSPHTPLRRRRSFPGRAEPFSPQTPSRRRSLSPSKASCRLIDHTAHLIPTDATVNSNEYRSDFSKMITLLSLAHNYLVPSRDQMGQWHAQSRDERGGALKIISMILGDLRTSQSHEKTPSEQFLLDYWDGPWDGGVFQLPTLAYTDACSIGIGFYLPISQRALAWTWRSDADIPRLANGSVYAAWGELIAVEMTIHTLLVLHEHHCVTSKRPSGATIFAVLSDNKDVVGSVRARQWVDHTNTYFHILDAGVKRIVQICKAYGVELDLRWIPGRENHADPWSRMQFDQHESLRMECWWTDTKNDLSSVNIPVVVVPDHLRDILVPCWHRDEPHSPRKSPSKRAAGLGHPSGSRPHPYRRTTR